MIQYLNIIIKDQTCWLKCRTGFVWKEQKPVNTEKIAGEVTTTSSAVSCLCPKKSSVCSLTLPIGMCVPAAFADVDF